MRVVEVSQVEAEDGSGMGRVCRAWGAAFERRGHAWLHVGPAQVGPVAHPYWFARAARRWIARHAERPDVFLVHEPAGAPFVDAGVPAVVFSHGLERRAWETSLAFAARSGERISLKSRLIYPLWRLRACDAALRGARHVLVLNRDDARYVRERYGRDESDVSVVRNGIRVPIAHSPPTVREERSILFVGSWLPRKGIRVLAAAALRLAQRGVEARWTLAGTHASREEVLRLWPRSAWDRTTVVPRFSPEEEPDLYARASVFALASFFEGQPLALLEAMAHGCCCVTTDCCGQRDLIQDGVHGLLVARGDAEGLAACLERALVDSELCDRLGSAARRVVEDRTWDRVGDAVAVRVEQVAGRG